MRLRTLDAALIALALITVSCVDSRSLNPVAPRRGDGAAPRFATSVATLPAVRISEFHYDNVGTDAGEAIEISGPANMSITGWSVVLYNGNGGAAYATTLLTGAIPSTCGGRGVVVINYPQDGIQNGSPDGIALVDDANNVIEFLSYEGTFTAVGGAANGMVATDIGVAEGSTTPIGSSLQRNANGAWGTPSPNTFRTCNDAESTPPGPIATITVSPANPSVTQGANQQFIAAAFDSHGTLVSDATFSWSATPATVTIDANGLATSHAPGDAIITASVGEISGSTTLHVTTPGLPNTRFSEIHYDNAGSDAGEAIEIEGPVGTSLAGWSIVLYDGNGASSYNTTVLSGTVPATCGTRGVVVTNYPVNGIQNGSPDGFALVDNAGHVVEFLSYEGSFTAANGPAAGMISTDIGVLESSSPIGQSLQRNASGVWQAPATSSFGGCNGAGSTPNNVITFSGRDGINDPPLPIGFEDQLFATLHSGGTTVTTTFTWSSETPAIASIDQNGVIHALAEGMATFRATAADGTTGTIALSTIVATASTTAHYANNTEFGDPVDADPSDDFIVRRDQYTTSYNKNRGTPNWVSYDLDASHFGTNVDRCDCFTFDPALPASFTHLTTADYTGAGAAAGFGIDRGHLVRSFDRTSASLDNAFTYYLSNIVPQASDLNQGPWAQMENFLGDLARNQNKEVYIIAGVAGSKGTVKNEGKIVIPASTWKIAVVTPRDEGLTDVHSVTDVDVFAVIMPNESGIRNVDWHTYQTTVDAIEALTGYDLLSKLPDNIEIPLEANDHAPTARIAGTAVVTSGSPVSFTGTASTDPDVGDVLTYAWNFGDGTSAAGSDPDPTHTFFNIGTYTVTLTVTDRYGLTSSAQTTVSVIRAREKAMALPGVINLNDRGRGGIDVVLLSRPGFDATQVALASATIGGVSVDTHGGDDKLSYEVEDANGDGLPDVRLRFSRVALIEAGALTASSSELVLLADLLDGTQVEGHAPVLTRTPRNAK